MHEKTDGGLADVCRLWYEQLGHCESPQVEAQCAEGGS